MTAPLPLAKAPSGKGWLIASAITLVASGFLVVVLSLVLAALKLSGNHIEGPQDGWNAVIYVMYAGQVAITGWGGLVTLLAAVFALVGLTKNSSKGLGIALLVVCLVLSLQLLAIPFALTTYDFYIY